MKKNQKRNNLIVLNLKFIVFWKKEKMGRSPNAPNKKRGRKMGNLQGNVFTQVKPYTKPNLSEQLRENKSPVNKKTLKRMSLILLKG